MTVPAEEAAITLQIFRSTEVAGIAAVASADAMGVVMGPILQRETAQDNNRISESGCSAQPSNPANPMSAPSAVGTIATQKSHRFRVSAVSARSEIASATSVSERSNWSSR